MLDDEEAILDLILGILRDEGYRATPAINGDVALVILEQDLPFQLLITDIAMPGLLDGYALAHKARELRPDMSFIVRAFNLGYPAAIEGSARGLGVTLMMFLLF